MSTGTSLTPDLNIGFLLAAGGDVFALGLGHDYQILMSLFHIRNI